MALLSTPRLAEASPAPVGAAHQPCDLAQFLLTSQDLVLPFYKMGTILPPVGEQVRIRRADNVKHLALAQGLGHSNINSRLYYELQEHSELMAGPNVKNGYFCLIMFCFILQRGRAPTCC